MAYQNPQQQQSYLPESLQLAMGQARYNATKSINEGGGLAGLAARHPLITGLLSGIGAGVMTGNAGMGAIYGGLAPLAMGNLENNRQLGIQYGLNDTLESLLKQQEARDKVESPRAAAAYVDQLRGEGIEQGQINPNVPALDRNAPYSNEFLKTVLPGITGGYATQYGASMLTDMASRGRAMVEGPMSSTQKAQPGVMQGGVSTGRVNTLDLPIFIDPSTANTIVKQNQQAFDAGTKIPKTIAETANQNAQAGANTALGKLREAQRITETNRPGLIRAQTRQANSRASLNDRTDPNRVGGGSSGVGEARLAWDMQKTQLKQLADAKKLEGLRKGFIVDGRISRPDAGWFGEKRQQVAEFDQWLSELESLTSGNQPSAPSRPAAKSAARPAGRIPSFKAAMMGR